MPRPLLSLLLLALLIGAPALGEDAWRDDGTDASAWQLQPGWQANPSPGASVRSEAGVLLFSVPEAGKGMKFSRSLRAFPLSYYRWLVVRYRAENVRTDSGDYFIYLDDGAQTQCSPLRLQDVVADGAWHTVAVDASRLAAGPVSGLAVQVVPAGPGGGRVSIDSMAFTDTLPPDVQELRKPQAAAGPARPDWVMPLRAEGWQAHRDWLGNPADAPEVAPGDGGVTFRVTGANRGMKWSSPLPNEVPLGAHRYLSLRYRAAGLGGWGDYALCVLGTARGSGADYTPVLMPGALQADGRWHSLSVELAPAAARIPVAREIAVQVQAGSAPSASLTLGEVRLTDTPARPRLSDFITWKAGRPASAGAFVTLPLSGLRHGPVASLRERLGIEGWFDADEGTAEGIPFRLRAKGTEAARTGMLARGRPAVPVGRRVSEVYLLAASLFAGEEEEVRGGGPMVAIEDVDRFRLRLEYADGSVSECLPLDAGAGTRRVALGPRVLCAFADPSRTLARVVLDDRTPNAAFALLAATAHTGLRGVEERYRIRPQPAPQTPTAAMPQPGAPGAAVTEGGFRLWNNCLEATFEMKAGLSLVHLVHKGGPGEVLPAGGGQLLELTIGGKRIPPEALAFTDLRVSPEGPVYLTLAPREAGSGVKVRLTFVISGPELAMGAAVENAGAEPVSVAVRGPLVRGVRVGASATDNFYLFPQSGAVWNNIPTSLEQPFSGTFPLQFMDLYNRRTGGGVYLRTEDREGEARSYTLRRGEEGLTDLGLAYPERVLQPGARRTLVWTVIGVHAGDWHAALDAYRQWLKTWYRPAAPREAWFRGIFNFRQRFLWSHDPLYDARAGAFHLEKALEEGREFGGIDYLHLFDWGNCGQYGRIYGRTGDYSPYEYWAGGLGAFRKAIEEIQARNVPVGLYIEGYLLQEKGKLGQAHGKEWQRVGGDGKPGYWPNSTEMFVCPWVPAWRQVQAETYGRMVREAGVSGMYLDEFGFCQPHADCSSPEHGHPVPGSAVIGERGLTQAVRESISNMHAHVALHSEECPPDVNSAWQDGSFTYSMSRARRAPTPVPLNLLRFAVPSFKTFEILVCDHPTGSWATGVYWTFFNGEGIWLEGPAREWFEPQTLAAIRKCHAILRAHKDAFAGDDVEPLVPTLVEGVFANAFEAPGKTVYTLYNSHPETVTAEVLRVPHRPGMTYGDAWTGRPLKPRIAAEQAYLKVTLGPNEAGCIVVRDGTGGRR